MYNYSMKTNDKAVKFEEKPAFDLAPGDIFKMDGKLYEIEAVKPLEDDRTMVLCFDKASPEVLLILRLPDCWFPVLA